MAIQLPCTVKKLCHVLIFHILFFWLQYQVNEFKSIMLVNNFGTNTSCCTAGGRGGTIGRKSASMWLLTKFWTSNRTAAQAQVPLSTEEATPTICLLSSCIMAKASAQGTTPHTATIQKEVRKTPESDPDQPISSYCSALTWLVFFFSLQVSGSTVMTLRWRFAVWKKCATLRPTFSSIPRGLPRYLSLWCRPLHGN